MQRALHIFRKAHHSMADAPARSERTWFLPRACENCRVRKTRCNKEIPCTNCQVLGVQCQPASRSTGQRPRIVVSNHYENQLEAIQTGLREVEKGIQAVLEKFQEPSRASSATIATVERSPEIVASFEGESSFGNEILEASRSASSLTGGSAGSAIVSALSSLQVSLSAVETSRRLHDAQVCHSSSKLDVTLIPATLVIALVNKAKVTPPLCAVASSWTDFSQLERVCQRVYFPLQDVSSGAMALMHGMLYSLIQEFSQHDDPQFATYNLDDCAVQCGKNFYQCMERYETLITPTLENIQVLLLAAYRAQDESKLSLCWTFVSIAQTMCQTLGYHREPSYHMDIPQAAQAKRHAFFSLYVLDKNLSLVLGRTSNFNDNDMDAQPFNLSTNPKQLPWDIYTHIIIRFATIQGEIYDRLYSKSASHLSPFDRSCLVEGLSTRVIRLREELEMLVTTGAYFSDALQMSVASADFIAYAVLTVLYRAESGFKNCFEISSRCYDAARKSLESHLKCCADLQACTIYQQRDYVRNTLLYPSFTPYIIVFTHAIAKANDTDIALLRDTVRSLTHLSDFSPATRRLYQVCQSFLQVAEAVVESQESVAGLDQREDGSLVFATGPVSTQPEDQMAAAQLSTAWGNSGIFDSTAIPGPNIAGSCSEPGPETFNLWSTWLGSSTSVIDALHMDFTDV